jgi:hypothetical protein
MKDKYDIILISRPAYEQKIARFINTPLIKVITGIRRAGKSSLLKLTAKGLVSRGVDESRILFINMESLGNEPFRSVSFLHNKVKEQKSRAGDKLFLFIDEVQEIDQWEKAVNSFLADGDADIFISGSNSTLLSGEPARLLSGRYVEFPIFPLTYAEYKKFRSRSSDDARRMFTDFIRYGGMPGLYHLDHSEEAIYQYLSALIDSVLLKDVVVRNSVRDVSLLNNLLRYVADNSGNIFSARSVADYFKKERRTLGIETVYNYLNYLETAFIINRVSRYDIKGKRLHETYGKYYFTDIGLRHALIGYKEKDINLFLENIIYIELRKRGYTVSIGKIGDLEIDFIAAKSDAKIYIQAAYVIADQRVQEREFRPLQLVRDNYPKYVLSMDDIPESNEEGIIRMNLVQFLESGEL